MEIKKTINKILLSLNILMSAIGVINLADDIVPAFIKFTEFFRLALNLYERIRDIVLAPLTIIPEKLFNIYFPDWLKSYLILGLLFLATYEMVLRQKKFSIKKSKKYHLRYTVIVKGIFLFGWPFFLFQIIQNEFRPKDSIKYLDNYGNWGKNLIWVFLSALTIVFVNWMWIRITN